MILTLVLVLIGMVVMICPRKMSMRLSVPRKLYFETRKLNIISKMMVHEAPWDSKFYFRIYHGMQMQTKYKIKTPIRKRLCLFEKY